MIKASTIYLPNKHNNYYKQDNELIPSMGIRKQNFNLIKALIITTYFHHKLSIFKEFIFLPFFEVGTTNKESWLRCDGAAIDQ